MEGEHGDKDVKWLSKLEKLRKEKKLKRTKDRAEEGMRDSGKTKKNKKKKNKRKSHKKRKDEPRWKKTDSDSNSEPDSSGVWVDSQTEQRETEPVTEMDRPTDEQYRRDAWMLAPLPSTKMFDTKKKEQKERREAEPDDYRPSYHSLELNPFWKDGGSGLPEVHVDGQSVPKLHAPTSEISPPSSAERSRCGAKRSPCGAEKSPCGTECREAETESLVTDSQLNKLGARATRAELMGDNELAAKLRAELKDLQEKKLSQGKRQMKQDESGEETVLLTHSDSHGNIHPFSSSHDNSDRHRHRGAHRRKHGKDASYGKDGKRSRYFADDDDYNLQDLIAQEKRTSADDVNRSLYKMAGHHLEKMGANSTLDDMFVSSAGQRAALPMDSKRDKAKALHEHRQLIKSKLSIDSPELEKQLIVCVGMKVYLAVPRHQPLVTGHCQLIPTAHCSCTVNLDEDVWAEIKVFRKGLVAMFALHCQDVIFMETATHLRRQPHMVLECIPVPKEQGHLAPLYFKKAILECESEWSQNKKLIDTHQKELRRSIPRGFSYFSVEFGLDGGYAHVIENEGKFPSYFGKEIIGGMLDLAPKLWRKPERESIDHQTHRATQFAQMWEQYDWTKQLKT